jgi:hypothetical protein
MNDGMREASGSRKSVRGKSVPGVKYLEQAGRFRPWYPRLGLTEGGIDFDIQQDREQFDPGDAVHHAVVNLEDHHPATALEALDE